jgi:hypothetical protein
VGGGGGESEVGYLDFFSFLFSSFFFFLYVFSFGAIDEE